MQNSVALNSRPLNQTVTSDELISYLSSLYRLDGSPIEKRLALQQILETIKTIKSISDNEIRCAQLFNLMLAFRYISDAIEYREDAGNDPETVIAMPDLDLMLLTLPRIARRIVKNVCGHRSVATFTPPQEEVSRLYGIAQADIGDRMETMLLADMHTVLSCIFEDNAESGIVSFREDLLSEFDFEGRSDMEKRYDFETLEVGEEELEFDFDEGEEFDEEDLAMSDEEAEEAGIESFRHILSTTMPKAIEQVANQFGWDDGKSGQFAALSAQEHLIVKAEADALDIEDAVEAIIESEEILRQEENERLAENESRIRDTFLSFVVDTAMNRELKSGVLYRLTEDRILEITGGNFLPVDSSLHSNVLATIAFALNIKPTNIRLILNSNYMAFVFISETDEGVLL